MRTCWILGWRRALRSRPDAACRPSAARTFRAQGRRVRAVVGLRLRGLGRDKRKHKFTESMAPSRPHRSARGIFGTRCRGGDGRTPRLLTSSLPLVAGSSTDSRGASHPSPCGVEFASKRPRSDGPFETDARAQPRNRADSVSRCARPACSANIRRIRAFHGDRSSLSTAPASTSRLDAPSKP